MTDSPVDPREIRVTDDEREHVVGLLQKAIGQGLITLDEFSTRTDTALAAKTRSELNAVLVDLPGVVRKDFEKTPPKQRLELRGMMTKLRRSGRWIVPRELVVRSSMSGCELDFTVARIEHAVVDVEFDVSAAPVKVWLPPNATVDVDDLRVSTGKLINNVRSDPGPGTHFVFKGNVRGGTVTIRRPMSIRIGSVVFRFPWKFARDSD